MLRRITVWQEVQLLTGLGGLEQLVYRNDVPRQSIARPLEYRNTGLAPDAIKPRRQIGSGGSLAPSFAQAG